MTFIGKTKHFAKWARQTGVTDLALSNAVREMEAGLIDADLGGGLVKKRLLRIYHESGKLMEVPYD